MWAKIGKFGALTLVAAAVPLARPVMAKVIGTNQPAQSLTRERIATLPVRERAAWLAYLTRSEATMRADRASLAAELRPGETPPPPPIAKGGGHRAAPLDRDAAWYASAEAKRIGDTIVSFQTPAGGWSKNQDRGGPARLRGQRYANDAETMVLDPTNFDAPVDRFWTFVGTIDNDATTHEMHYLGRLATALPGRDGDRYRASFVKGVRYLLVAQYPNGGWPQVYPLEGGFHDGITFNDNGVALVAMLLEDVGEDAGYRFVPADLRAKARTAVARATDVILRAQVRQNGRLTGWPQQVDALTLAPISARNYEPRSIASGETTDILMFLMRAPRPTPAVRAAIDAGVAWLQSVAVYDVAFTRTPEGRKLLPKPGAGPLWSRNYDLVTGKPIFGDKDKSIHDDVNGISEGRRNGYSWWMDVPKRAIAAYPAWQARVKG
ncbi:pectate lyase [uncultured Sphingomonas sp.]|uniref:pectate lyase n=1 Tax=uncultured Sphingomonas sp. TaxID=158754 RepID=UPI003748DA9B